jgi:hypothetical protein
MARALFWWCQISDFSTVPWEGLSLADTELDEGQSGGLLFLVIFGLWAPRWRLLNSWDKGLCWVCFLSMALDQLQEIVITVSLRQ